MLFVLDAFDNMFDLAPGIPAADSGARMLQMCSVLSGILSNDQNQIEIDGLLAHLKQSLKRAKQAQERAPPPS